ncbi:hypothetical protein A2U01_0110240, partial [Trifolium medium]|nr:hypothetical protein [Trifolium medium]
TPRGAATANTTMVERRTTVGREMSVGHFEMGRESSI